MAQWLQFFARFPLWILTWERTISLPTTTAQWLLSFSLPLTTLLGTHIKAWTCFRVCLFCTCISGPWKKWRSCLPFHLRTRQRPVSLKLNFPDHQSDSSNCTYSLTLERTMVAQYYWLDQTETWDAAVRPSVQVFPSHCMAALGPTTWRFGGLKDRFVWKERMLVSEMNLTLMSPGN